ncbi:MAG: glycosyl hydrolase [candidate division KSB1 bacterium]|nr:glycosyl hydrolase [candidate division KSB1 bacterium]
MRFLYSFCIMLLFLSCSNDSGTGPNDPGPAPEVQIVDPDASRETKYLFHNLRKYMGDAVMFGHQDDLAYGIDWNSEYGKSDVELVVGDYPAVYGWDLGDIESSSFNLDGVDFEGMKFWMQLGYKRGGINTASLHLDNPVSGGDAWDTERAVPYLLPGGSHHEKFKEILNDIAAFFKDIKGENDEPVPVIFRPWHEHNGAWFWWGVGSCTRKQYIDLWRFTVEYLRDTKNVHNLLYAYSPSAYVSDAEYLDRYPGDDYVDILGLDCYSLYSSDQIPTFRAQITRLNRMAASRGKVPALTETGYESIPIKNWWTQYLLRPIKHDSATSQLSFLLVWRNWTRNHHFAPYPGHSSAPDFIEFYNDPLTWFEADLPDMYGRETLIKVFRLYK